MLPTMTSPTAMRAIAPSRVPRSKLLTYLRSSNLDPFGRLGFGGLGRRRLLPRRNPEVDLEHLTDHGRGDAASVAAVLDQDRERDRRVLHRGVADEPRVVTERLGELVRVDARGRLVDLHGPRLSHDGDAGDTRLRGGAGLDDRLHGLAHDGERVRLDV